MTNRPNYNISEELWVRYYLDDRHQIINKECIPRKGINDDLYNPILNCGYCKKGTWFDDNDNYLGC